MTVEGKKENSGKNSGAPKFVSPTYHWWWRPFLYILKSYDFFSRLCHVRPLYKFKRTRCGGFIEYIDISQQTPYVIRLGGYQSLMPGVTVSSSSLPLQVQGWIAVNLR